MSDRDTETARRLMEDIVKPRWVDPPPEMVQRIASALSAAREEGAKAEREACAKVADETYADHPAISKWDDRYNLASCRIADAIRARGGVPEQNGLSENLIVCR